jgi:tRNA nucleotidyltransferase (CCA-adding enzyme)
VPIHLSKKALGKDFNDRGTKTIFISFQAPDIPADALHPQIKKTEKSLANILTREGFKLMGSDCWSDEQDYAVILLELETWNLPRLKKHSGPAVWNRPHSLRFREVHPQAWIEGDRWTAMVNREFQDVESILSHLLSPEGIRKVRGGKHVKKSLLEKYSLTDPDRLLETADEQISEFLYFYIHKSRRLWR